MFGVFNNDMKPPLPFDPTEIPSPCFVVDAEGLRRNGRILDQVRRESGATMLLALKAFAMPSAFSVVRPFLDGTTASSTAEALLAGIHFGGEVHAYAVAYTPEDFERTCHLARHVTLNSLSQWQILKPIADRFPGVSFGLRINPRYSEVETDLYNPCLPGSRFGMTDEDLGGELPEGIRGFHMHTLCEQGFGPLERTVAKLEEQFADLLPRLDWLNLGGGHHITKPDYDRVGLVRLIRRLQERYDLEVILEPGEAVAQQAGWLVASVLDVFSSQGVHHAILDISATAHMPDVLEMPYRPEIIGAGEPGERNVDVHLGGVTCLSGDRIGVYSFDRLPSIGDRMVFTDMAMYTMVKSSHFNGVQHPAIALWDDGALHLQKTFGYADVRYRLG
jgi:carboxynorspermidine decarboxylase